MLALSLTATLIKMEIMSRVMHDAESHDAAKRASSNNYVDFIWNYLSTPCMLYTAYVDQHVCLFGFQQTVGRLAKASLASKHRSCAYLPASNVNLKGASLVHAMKKKHPE